MRLALLGLIIGFAVPQGMGAVPEFIPDSDYERSDRMVDHKISITPKQPEQGINTGLVIFMGHPIRPPYRVEWQGEKIEVNGVPVFPSRHWEQQNARMRASINSRTPEEKKKSEVIWETTNKIQEMARRGESRAEIFRFAKKQTVFSRVEWESERTLRITSESDKWFLQLPRKGEERREFSEKEKAEMKVNSRQREIQNIERILRDDRMAIFTATIGPMGQMRTKEFPADVPKIMDDPLLDLKGKYQRIKDISWAIQQELAWEIVENYDPNEWKDLKIPARGPR